MASQAAARLEKVEQSLMCPITLSTFVDPVVLAETGHTYEREAIETWLRNNALRCPKTSRQLKSATLVPNYTVRATLSDLGLQVAPLLPDAAPTAQLDLSEGALINAIRTDNVDLVKAMLRAGANPNAIWMDHATMTMWSPLVAAATDNRKECLEALLRHGANVNIMVNSAPALASACTYNNPDCAKVLLKHGANINAVDPDFGMSPLMFAAMSGATDCLSVLLEHGGVNIHAVCADYEDTALHYAAGKGSHLCVEQLLRFGADTTKTNKVGWNPVMFAAKVGNAKCVQLLLQSRADDATKVDKEGRTALQLAAANGHTECVQLLLQSRHVFKIKEERSALQLAAANCHTECVQLLQGVVSNHKWVNRLLLILRAFIVLFFYLVALMMYTRHYSENMYTKAISTSIVIIAYKYIADSWFNC